MARSIPELLAESERYLDRAIAAAEAIERAIDEEQSAPADVQLIWAGTVQYSASIATACAALAEAKAVC